ncbi:TolC family protein [Nitrogeniibacter mangrovi]|uniref:TolC family protein n=1 Tax=Nitrogeniibacter mangrovi TaxID=2016596 RepID=A0A6C1AZT3_9RHOO|nr:TolC family protein [Nitrogeniibacter mangrovi]QID16155.1 TolC family protein [Nitrogeniibacter mangrovi]
MRRSLILACAALAGCASYVPAPITPAGLAQQFEQRSLTGDDMRHALTEQLGHAPASWPPARWDRTLLTRAAWHFNPELAIARARWQRAVAGIEVAGAMPNPTLQLPLEYTTDARGTTSPWTAGLLLDIPIETAGKRDDRIRQAQALAEAARLDVLDRAWQVRGEVRQALLGLFGAREHRRLARRQVADREQIHAMIERRVAVGDSPAAAADLSALALSRARTALAAAEGAWIDARATLARAIGVPVAALDALRLDLDEFDRPLPPAPDDADRAALFHRADLLASLARYEASQAALQLEVARQYPDIHLGPGFSYDQGDHRIAFGLPGITLPVFDRNQGGIAEAEAGRKEAAARTAALQYRILNALERAVSRYRQARRTDRAASDALASATRTFARLKARFAAGDIGRLALVQAATEQDAAAIDHLNARLATQRAAGDLENAMQMPLGPATEAAAAGVSP